MRKQHANHGRDHLPGGADPIPVGPGGGDCPDCVLSPFTVNPGDIFVPPEFRDCTDAEAGTMTWDTVCGTNGVDLGTANAGKCGMYLLGYRIQTRGRIFFGGLGYAENFQVTPGVTKTWDTGESPLFYDTGWVTVDDGYCGAGCDDEITISASFFAANSSFGNCTDGGDVFWRWVKVDDIGAFEGALDDLPQGEQQNDVIHFDSRTHDWVTSPSSVPSRAISTFMG